jgi:hypothetical protein
MDRSMKHLSERPFRRGATVEVRPPHEILKTLDGRGELAGLPFMPEMARLCGHRFTVIGQAERVCDTITDTGCASRRMLDTVLLDDARCDGGGHGGCQAKCRIYWKTAWLRNVPRDAPAPVHVSESAVQDLINRLCDHSSYSLHDGATRFRCQATQMVEASIPLSRTDLRSYLRVYSSGNVSLPHFARIMLRASIIEIARRFNRRRDVPLRGASQRSPLTRPLDLSPGELVRVRSPREVRETLTMAGANRGLSFDREMVPFCGHQFSVADRVNRLIDERTGELLTMKSDCIALDGVECSGEYSWARWFCSRGIIPLWRECWLERVQNHPGVACAEVLKCERV